MKRTYININANTMISACPRNNQNHALRKMYLNISIEKTITPKHDQKLFFIADQPFHFSAFNIQDGRIRA